MIRYLLFILFVATMGSRALGLDFGLAPGISLKNALLYLVASVVAVEIAMLRNRHVELMTVILPFALLILYALLTWVFTLVFVENPFYLPRPTLIRLKVKLVDQFLMFLVFFYGVVSAKDAVWLLRALTWTVVVGCLITVIDTFNIPDLGIIGARDTDGRIEGILGSAQEFGGLLAFFIPACFALWWTSTGLQRSLAMIGIGLMLVCLMLSASRGAMLGLVAGAVISAVYLRKYLTAQILGRATLVVVVITVLAVLAVFTTEYGYLVESRVTSGLDSGDAASVSSGRTTIWAAAWREMAEYPLSFITGLGWEAYYQTMGHRYATHSVYLDRLYNLGIIGLALFVFSYISAMATARRGIALAAKHEAPFLIAVVIGISAYMIAMAFSDIHGAAIYNLAFAGLALRIVMANFKEAHNRPVA